MLRDQPRNVDLVRGLAMLYVKLDQPNSAVAVYEQYLGVASTPTKTDQQPPSHEQQKHETTTVGNVEDGVPVWLGLARAHEWCQDMDAAQLVHRQALLVDPSNVEAIAALAARICFTLGSRRSACCTTDGWCRWGWVGHLASGTTWGCAASTASSGCVFFKE